MIDLNSIPTAMYYKNSEGKYIECNTAFLELIGKSRLECIGHTDHDIFPNSLAEQFVKWDAELLQGQKRQVLECKFPKADGSETQVLVQRMVSSGYIIGTIVDLTEERRVEQEHSSSMVMAAPAEMAIQTIEGMIDPVIILNKVGTIERINRGFTELFGTSKPFIGSSIASIFNDISEKELQELLARCHDENRIRNLQAHVTDFRGVQIPVLVNISRIRDSQRAIDGFVVAIRDISHLEEATKQIKEKERQLDAILNASEDAVVLIDPAGTIKSGNRALSTRYKIPQEDLAGKGFFELSDTHFKEIQSYFLESIVNSGNPQQIEYEHDGKIFYNSGYPIFNTEGTVEEIAVFSYDITDRKKSEQLQRALYSISEAAYFARDMYTLFKIVHRIVSKLIPAENLMIILRDTETGALHCPYYVIGNKELAEDERHVVAFQDGLVELLLEKGTSVLLKDDDIRILTEKKSTSLQMNFPKEWVGVPLVNGEGVIIGALVIHTFQKDKGYDDGDRKILNFVSSQIAMAIERKLNEEALRSKNILLKGLTEGTILALVRAVEIRDPYTAGHQQRVAFLSEAIIRKIGLNEERIEATRIASLLHDVGKIAVPSELLSKPGKLSELELQLIRQHPVESYNILRNVKFSYPIAQYVLEHHEKMNGSGYPAGLKGNTINLESRIICVADVVDAMASHRPYRPAWGIEQALAEIEAQSGILYDSEVVTACLELFREDGFSFSRATDETITLGRLERLEAF